MTGAANQAGQRGASGGDLVGRVLAAHGVRFLFTLCGGHISPILLGAERAGIEVVDVRDEVTAAFAADAVARLSGVPGVAAVTAGPGVTNTVTALKNAQLAQSPLVLLGGATATVLEGRGSLQDIDQLALVRSMVKKSFKVKRLRQIVPALTGAFEAAAGGVPGPVFVELPVDLLYQEEVIRGWYADKLDKKPTSLRERALQWYLRRHLERLFAGGAQVAVGAPEPVPPPAPPAAAVGKAAAALGRAERPVLVVGSQAMVDAAAVDELAAAVDRLGVPVYLAGMARGLLGRGHRLQLRHKRKKALREADLVLLAGFPCDFRLDYGSPIRRRGTTFISVNRSRHDLKLNRRPDQGVLADPGLFLRRLAEKVEQAWEGHWDGWLEDLRQRDAARDGEIAAQARAASGAAAGESGGETLVDPLALFAELERILPDDSVLVGDGGDFVATAAYTVSPRGPLRWLDPGVFGTLGVGAGFALGARLCRPSSEVWILYGDGAAGYSLIELDTFARHGLPVIALVGNDASWAQIAREQVDILGTDLGTVLARTDYHRAAEGLGAVGIELRRNRDIAHVLAAARQAAANGKPVLVNVHLASSDFRKGSISM